MQKTVRRLYFLAREMLGHRTRLLKPANYAAYRATQIEGNRRKLGHVFAHEANIAVIAAYAENRIGSVRSVLCHGVRNGRELEWFAKHLSGAPEMLGTDISDTATQFPHCIQWDFHDENPDWLGKWDLIYSNSWDHAFDPERAFAVWVRCLSPRGLLVLEHSRYHNPDKADALDPFGASIRGLRETLDRAGAPDFAVIDTLHLPNGHKRRRAVIVSRIL